MTGTLNGTTCPRECRVRLKHVEERLDKTETTHDSLWEELKMKVSQKMFFWMMGIAVVILLATFGAIYRQGGMTLEKVQAAQIDQAKMKETLKNHTENSERIRKWIHERERSP